MILKYKLNKDLCGRAAAQLNWNLNSLCSEIHLKGERIVNGKSLIGILAAQFYNGEEIEIIFDQSYKTDKIREYFNEVGREINEPIEQQI